MVVPVRYLNREGSSGAYLAGDYYISLSADVDSDGETYELPYTLQVEVVGEPAGEPSYTEGLQTDLGDLTPAGQTSDPADEQDADSATDTGRQRPTDDSDTDGARKDDSKADKSKTDELVLTGAVVGGSRPRGRAGGPRRGAPAPGTTVGLATRPSLEGCRSNRDPSSTSRSCGGTRTRGGSCSACSSRPSVWSQAWEGQWQDKRPLFWLDVGAGALAYVLVMFRRRWPLPVAIATSALGLVVRHRRRPGHPRRSLPRDPAQHPPDGVGGCGRRRRRAGLQRHPATREQRPDLVHASRQRDRHGRDDGLGHVHRLTSREPLGIA